MEAMLDAKGEGKARFIDAKGLDKPTMTTEAVQKPVAEDPAEPESFEDAVQREAAKMALEFNADAQKMRQYWNNAYGDHLVEYFKELTTRRPGDPTIALGQMLAGRKHKDDIRHMPQTQNRTLIEAGPRRYLRSTIDEAVVSGIEKSFHEKPKRPMVALGDHVCALSPSYVGGLVEKIRAIMKSGWKQFRADCDLIYDKFEDEVNETVDIKQAKLFFDAVGKEHLQHYLSQYLDEDKFERFDFDGSLQWNFFEAFRCLKQVLIEIFEENGGVVDPEVETNTLEERGLEKIKLLGTGGQGEAWLCSCKKRGEVALKVYRKDDPNAARVDELIDELQVLKKMDKSPYTMRAYDVFQDDSCLYCVTEVFPGGELGQIREKAVAQGLELSEDYFRYVFAQCLEGLRHMHQKALMHCDIKEPNIMFRNEDYAKPQAVIIDMGMARNAAGHGRAGGTPGYMPPETMKNNIWYPKGDIFSMGVTFFQILADMTPDEDAEKAGVFQEGARNLKDVERIVCTREVPMDLIQENYPGTVPWLSQMLDKNRKNRPVSPQLLQDPWFSQTATKVRASCSSFTYDPGSPMDLILSESPVREMPGDVSPSVLGPAVSM